MEKKDRRKLINITNNLSLQKHSSSFTSDWWGCNLHLLSPTMIWFPHHPILLLCTKLGGMVCFGAAIQWHCRINKMVMVTSQVSSQSKLFFFSIMWHKKPFPFMLELQTHQVCSYGWHTSSSLSIMLGQKVPNR
jgi:hypothetical protein